MHLLGPLLWEHNGQGWPLARRMLVVRGQVSHMAMLIMPDAELLTTFAHNSRANHFVRFLTCCAFGLCLVERWIRRDHLRVARNLPVRQTQDCLVVA